MEWKGKKVSLAVLVPFVVVFLRWMSALQRFVAV